MNELQIANNLLMTYDGIEGTAINPGSWFNTIDDTAKEYKISQADAKQAHSLAYWIYLNEGLYQE